MTWHELVGQVAARAGLPEATTLTVLRALVGVATEDLAAGGKVTLHGLGTFTTTWRAGGTVRHIRTGRKLSFDGRNVARFTASAPLRAAIAARAPQHLKDPAHQDAARLAAALIADVDLYHRDRVPTIPPGVEAARVDALCASALGPVWTAARTTYSERVPTHVQEARDWLAESAARRWQAA